MDILQNIFSFILAIGILVTVHEFGHFWVARRMGVQVLRFSVGFGKPLFKYIDKQGTEFVVAAIPLGGYVRMLGEQDDEITDENRHLAFNHKPLRVKTAIVVAGPLFNLLFAVAAYWLMFVSGIPGQIPVIGEIKTDSIAWHAGLKSDEKIVRINDKTTPTWSAVNTALLGAALSDNVIRIETLSAAGINRHRYDLHISERSKLLDEKGVIHNLGIKVWQPPVWIGEITTGSPAEKSGLKKGDLVLAVDNQRIQNWGEWVSYIRERPEIKINLRLLRGSDEISLQVLPRRVKTEDGHFVGQIGVHRFIPESVRQEHISEIRYGPLPALGHAVARTYDISVLMLKMLGRMVIGEASHRNISGPITIAQYAGMSASLGWLEFIRFLALISISLGVLNLLPIPMLDGGHLLYYVIEFVRGEPLPEQAQIFGQQVGIALLLLLMGLAFYNDLDRFLG